MPEVKPLVIDAVTGATRETVASDTLPPYLQSNVSGLSISQIKRLREILNT